MSVNFESYKIGTNNIVWSRKMETRNPDKYIFDTQSIEMDCYSLLAFFFASPSIHSITLKESQSQLHRLPLSERWLIKEFLISIAIKIRMIDDLMSAHGRKSYLPVESVVDIECEGEITHDNLREACNKIIHATSLNFQHDSSHDEALIPKMILRGTKGKNKWIARLDIIPFTRAACELCNTYDEDWTVSAY